MDSPYRSLPPRNFWQTGVTDTAPRDLSDVYRKRFDIPVDARIATAGSCFARQIGRRLRAHGFNFVDVEPPPPGLPETLHSRLGYGLFSARYGNIYSARQLNQLMKEAFGEFSPADRVWESGGRYYDPWRPSIEPDGFGSAREVAVLREAHLAAVRALFRACDVFIFTLGLTETWRSTEDGAVYPMCPGTIAGRFDSGRHVFVNSPFDEIVADMSEFIGRARAITPSMRFVLTVSPVPQAATATDQHVLCATSYSKSVLRAACGLLCSRLEGVDYFPSYEILTSSALRGMFFAENLRNITPDGVDFVMSHFFHEHAASARTGEPVRPESDRQEDPPNPRPVDETADGCDEVRLAWQRVR